MARAQERRRVDDSTYLNPHKATTVIPYATITIQAKAMHDRSLQLPTNLNSQHTDHDIS
jgi:hypothetical protein